MFFSGVLGSDFAKNERLIVKDNRADLRDCLRNCQLSITAPSSKVLCDLSPGS